MYHANYFLSNSMLSNVYLYEVNTVLSDNNESIYTLKYCDCGEQTPRSLKTYMRLHTITSPEADLKAETGDGGGAIGNVCDHFGERPRLRRASF